MTTTTQTLSSQIFGRRREDGLIDILDDRSGERVTQMPTATDVYPWTVNDDGQATESDTSCAYEHAAGIVLGEADALRLGLQIEAL